MEKVKIVGDYITLGQLLKLKSIISYGGEAKIFLQNNEVLVNEMIETRRGRKLYPNDIVKVLNHTYQLSH